jgi:hypothetical protein
LIAEPILLESYQIKNKAKKWLWFSMGVPLSPLMITSEASYTGIVVK